MIEREKKANWSLSLDVLGYYPMGTIQWVVSCGFIVSQCVSVGVQVT